MPMTNATSPSSAADRVRRYRQRRAAGRQVASVEIGPDEIGALVENALLAVEDAGDRAAVGWAIELLLLGLAVDALEIDTDRLIEALDEGE